MYRCWALFSNVPPPNLSNLSENLYLPEFSLQAGTPLEFWGVLVRYIFLDAFLMHYWITKAHELPISNKVTVQ